MKAAIKLVGLVMILAFAIQPALRAEPVLDSAPSPSVQLQTNVFNDSISVSSEPFLGEADDALLGMMSNLLNQEAHERASNSFEMLRRKSALQLEASMTSQFLAHDSAQRSA